MGTTDSGGGGGKKFYFCIFVIITRLVKFSPEMSGRGLSRGVEGGGR